ncbi:putative enzyme [metagenome]|uniref:Putative enzyme n=1 Tax=metagenome TaxID=256318 RepID=A0A2P2C5G7_9ZZZZ
MRTVGVEEELMLFRDGRPAAEGHRFFEDPTNEVEHELMLEQAEIASAPTTELTELAQDLRASRRELVDSAAARGVTAVALGTSPVAVQPTPTPDPRYEQMMGDFGLIAAEQLICGTHVHVAVSSRAEGVRAIDGVRRWLSVLTAISANSPYWNGRDTGYASYRTVSWGRWPSTGPSPAFGDERAYDREVQHLLDTGAALDRGMVYYDVRLSARYPTVEFRVADVGQHVSDSVLLAGLCRAAVETALADPSPPDPSVAELKVASWRAARHGLGGELIDVVEGRLRPAGQVVDRMLFELTSALHHAGDLTLITQLMDALWQRGTGADLQRADVSLGGPAGAIAGAARRVLSWDDALDL